ncbi:hypothetical protein H4Q26_000484 [Puccinia striiformis f. sp. tritici PST-130]|nr:hypothetical protein H4Q26_000484 [Puccinia striiformis f. sp. tritici PST-130]
MTGPPLYLTDTNYGPWAFLMKSKLDKIGAWQVVTGEKQLKEEDKPDEKSNILDWIEWLQTNSSSTWTATISAMYPNLYRKRKPQFLELQYIDSTANFIAEARAINHRLVSAKVGLDDQVKTSMLLRKLPSSFRSFRDVISVGCANDTVAIMLNRLEKHAAQNHLDRVSMTDPQHAFLATATRSTFVLTHPERRNALKSDSSASSSKSKLGAQAHLAFTPVINTPPHGFTSEQAESERNFQAMLANPEYKRLHPNVEYRL